MIYLLRYWKPLAIGLLLVGLFGLGWYQGHKSASNACKADKAAQYAEQLRAIEKERQRANEIDQRLQAELAKPQVGPSIREIIRDRPSACRVDAAVADRLRIAVESANAAAR